jgi:hypothetical protein
MNEVGNRQEFVEMNKLLVDGSERPKHVPVKVYYPTPIADSANSSGTSSMLTHSIWQRLVLCTTKEGHFALDACSFF